MKCRKWYRNLLMALLILVLAIPARADVLWEPLDSGFYVEHYEESNYIDAIYQVPQGSTANLYSDPETGEVLDTLEEGTRVYVGPSLNWNGEIWASGYPLGEFDKEGWFRLGRLQKEYDAGDFQRDFGAQFTQTEEEVTGDTVLSWTYPGSGVLEGRREEVDEAIPIQSVYTDPDGGRWGYVGYWRGWMGWVYLEDPAAEETPVFPQTPENTVTDSGPETAPSAGQGELLLVAALALGVSGVTVLLLLRRKPDKG